MKTSLVLGLAVALGLFADMAAGDRAPENPAAPKPDTATYHEEVLAFLRKTCFGCHGEKVYEDDGGEIRLDNLDPVIDSGEEAERWIEIKGMVSLAEMPKKKWVEKHGPPSQSEVETLVDWVTGEKSTDTSSGGGRMITNFQWTPAAIFQRGGNSKSCGISNR